MAEPFSFVFPDSVNQMVLQSPSYIKSSDNTDLAYYKFVPLNPRAVIVFYHGGGFWSGRIYQYMALQLSEHHNIGVYLFDIRGHGNSHGERGDAPSAEAVWGDISTAINFVEKQSVNIPVFLSGHSSGAGLILNYSLWPERKKVDGYILLAPFLGALSKTAYEHTQPEKRFVKKVKLFQLIIGSITNGFFFAHAPVIFFNYPESEKYKDPFILDYYTTTMALATSPHDAKQIFTQLDAPCCMLIGELDEQFIPEAIVKFGHYLPNALKSRSSFQVTPHATHLSMVIESPKLIVRWIDNFLKTMK